MAATVDQKLLRQTKFPPEFNQKVDMTRVNVEVMKKWVTLGFCYQATKRTLQVDSRQDL